MAASWAQNQATIRVGTLSATAITNRHRARTTEPPTIHGRRRPQREVVRSDSRPNSGLPIRAAIAPIPRIRPCAVVARSAPTIVVTLIAMLTVTGPSRAMNSASCAKPKPNANFAPTGSLGGGMSYGVTGRSWPGSPEVTTEGGTSPTVRLLSRTTGGRSSIAISYLSRIVLRR